MRAVFALALFCAAMYLVCTVVVTGARAWGPMWPWAIFGAELIIALVVDRGRPHRGRSVE